MYYQLPHSPMTLSLNALCVLRSLGTFAKIVQNENEFMTAGRDFHSCFIVVQVRFDCGF